MNIEAETKNVYGTECVLDGVLNQELYDVAPFRVLWILREAWFHSAWTMLQKEGVYGQIFGSPTLHPMVYVTYSIFNGFPKWGDMRYIRDKPDMAEVLRSVAYINVKKTVGGTSSNLGEIHTWFKKGEEILRNQMLEYRPDVIIGCRPYMQEIFHWDTDRSEPISYGQLFYVSDPGKPLLIEAPHPSHRGKREVYVNTLVEVIQKEIRKAP